MVNDHNINKIRTWFYKAEWYEVFDFIEFSLKGNSNRQKEFNTYPKREKSAYRLIDGTLSEINSKEEVQELENVFSKSYKYEPVKVHINRAIELYSDRQNPDYRNSIKESISAVESLVIFINCICKSK